MDGQIIVVIISIVIVVGISWLDKLLKRPKSTGVHRTATSQARPSAPRRTVNRRPPTPTVPQNRPETEPVAESVAAFEEGGRVTVDEAQPIQVQQEEHVAVSRDELRKLVVWSEILRPKFDRD